MGQNALFHHRAQGFCHGFCSCPHWTWWYMNLQPRGLSIVKKVYGNKIFQGLLKDNNHWNKLNFDCCLLFMRFEANLLTNQFQFPFLLTFPWPSTPLPLNSKIFWTSTTFISFTPTLNIQTCLRFLSSHQNLVRSKCFLMFKILQNNKTLFPTITYVSWKNNYLRVLFL